VRFANDQGGYGRDCDGNTAAHRDDTAGAVCMDTVSSITDTVPSVTHERASA